MKKTITLIFHWLLAALILTSCGTPGNPSDPLGDLKKVTPSSPPPASATLRVGVAYPTDMRSIPGEVIIFAQNQADGREYSTRWSTGEFSSQMTIPAPGEYYFYGNVIRNFDPAPMRFLLSDDCINLKRVAIVPGESIPAVNLSFCPESALNQPANEEARIRYILADIQLSNLVSYYRGFPDDVFAVEAVRRWDQGIRVTNINAFSRIQINGKWTVVYTNTSTAINGLDVQLSQPAPQPTRTPTEANTGEARIRYILADIQLSGLVSYYRGFPNDSLAVEAVRRWDQGVRVTNISAFSRKQVNGSWAVVYAGTNNIINGMAVQLGQASGSGCSNPYWPVVNGATWTYNIMDFNGRKTGTEVHKISKVGTFQNQVTFTLTVNGAFAGDFICKANGQIDMVGGSGYTMFLPPPAEMTPNRKWSTGRGELLYVGIQSVQVPAGKFNAALFASTPGAQWTEYWMSGVGRVKMAANGWRELVSYKLGP